jgi:SAM-dependent methyltransferase
MAETFHNDERFVFHHLSVQPLYQGVATYLVEGAGIHPEHTVVDLGCGSGAATELIFQKVDASKGGRVFGVEPSHAELNIAQERFKGRPVQLFEAPAEQAWKLVPAADVALLCNVVHLIPPDVLPAFFADVARVLKPGGVLGFNTTFFPQAIAPGTQWFYTVWMRRAARHLQENGVELAPATRPASEVWITPERCRELLPTAGLGADIRIEAPQVQFTCEDWEALSQYSMFVDKAFPGVPTALGSEALRIGVRHAFEFLKLKTVPRHWLHVFCRKS